jgi:integrase
LKYRYLRKEKKLHFGSFPDVSLIEARAQREAALALLRDGIDPSTSRKQEKAKRLVESGQTFRSNFERWLAIKRPSWAERYATQVEAGFERDILPAIGALPIVDVTVPLVLTTLLAVQDRGAVEAAHRFRQHMSEIFLSAIGAGLIATDPAHVVRPALKPISKGRRPAIRLITEARVALDKIEASGAYSVTLLASRLLALTAARPGVVRVAQRHEFEGLDTPRPLWRVSAEKMKLTKARKQDAAYEFVMPLSHQAVDVVKTAMGLAGPHASYLFPSVNSTRRPISDSTLSGCYLDAGLRGQLVPHGWRSTFSTVMNERAAIEGTASDRQIIDLMLAHVQGGTEIIYNRAAYMPRRREIAQQWADLLLDHADPASSLVRTD